MMLRGLFVGRFQPFHNGHREAIKYVIKNVDELVIVVGSAQVSHEIDNPFTAGERIMMLKMALKDILVDPLKCYLVPIPDASMHSVWVPTVISYTPPFNIVFSNEPLTSRLFKEFGIIVEKIPFFNRDTYSATEVRRRMLVGENWKELLPGSIVKVVEDIDGVARLKELTLPDSFSKR